MGPYYTLICPKCGGEIEFDDTYDSTQTEDSIVNYLAGHCSKCQTLFQWEEEYTVRFDGVTNLEEC